MERQTQPTPRPPRKASTPDPEYKAAIAARQAAVKKARAEGKPLPPSFTRNKKTGQIEEAERTIEEVRMTAAEKAREAANLRIQRYSWDTIAKRLGYNSRGSAYSAVQRHIKNIPREAVEELRNLELESLDVAETALSDAINAGDTQAINAMLKVKEQRAKLVGLYDLPSGGGQDVALIKLQVASEVARLITAHPDMTITDVINEITKR